MAGDTWFRMYNTAVDHPKVMMLSDAVFRAWVRLMSLASKLGGTIPPDMALIAATLRKSPGKAADIVQVLQSAVLLDPVDGGGWVLHNWNEKQFKSDVSTNRVRAFRERSRNVSETDHSTETETETERKNTLPDKSGGVVAAKVIPEDFETFYKAYNGPKNSKKPEALKAWAATAKIRPPLQELLRAVANYSAWIADESRKQKRDYPKQHHSTWLRGEMWNNYGDGGAALTPEQIAANRDRADFLFHRGKYAEIT